jgi:hypothetical protein
VNDVLAEMGVQPITSVGETFDPHYHEAVATEESDEHGPNTISAELLRGYRIGERVIRHSMVKVTKPKMSDGSNSNLYDSEEDVSATQTVPPSDDNSGENPNAEN